MSPLFTIGIAFRNPGQFFELALKSVFAQTRNDWELLLVDDGSTDGSVELAKSLDDPRVRVLADGNHRNLNIRLNQMVREARTPYFVRMDADDMMHPRRLEEQLSVLEANGKDTVVGSSAYSIDAQSKILGRRRTQLNQRRGIDAIHSFIHPTVSAATEWFCNNPYSESFIFHRSQDAELWCRTTGHTKFVVIDKPLLFYREGGTFSFSNYLGTKLGVIHLITKYGNAPLHRYAFRLGVELAKTGAACFAETYGKTKWMTSGHAYEITRNEVGQAASLIGEIQRVSLPVRASGSILCRPLEYSETTFERSDTTIHEASFT